MKSVGREENGNRGMGRTSRGGKMRNDIEKEENDEMKTKMKGGNT